jgi:hypothetical protein
MCVGTCVCPILTRAQTDGGARSALKAKLPKDLDNVVSWCARRVTADVRVTLCHDRARAQARLDAILSLVALARILWVECQVRDVTRAVDAVCERVCL